MKMIIGKPRRKKSTSTPEQAVFVLGLVLMCCMLALPLFDRGADSSFEYDAVAVMGNAVEETREEIQIPDTVDTSAEEEWSFYDYIGRLFAGLIFGEW